MPAAALLAVFAVECLVLYWGQRQIFGLTAQRSRLLAYFLAMPGTALHEFAHLIMCKLLGVPTGRVELFRPRQMPNGSITLGQVMHAETDPLRGALIAIAPLLLVPPFLLGALRLLYGAELFVDPISAFTAAAIWAQLLGIYLLVSSGAAAFPSPGDHIPPFGAVILAGGLVLGVYLIGLESLRDGLEVVVLVLAPAALSAGLQMILLRR